jgi:hypothetical protein
VILQGPHRGRTALRRNGGGFCCPLALAAVACLLPLKTPAAGFFDPDRNVGLGVELGPAWFSRNDVRIPGDDGTKFDMLDLTGEGPDFFARAEAWWDIDAKHGLRVVLAPLEVSGSGNLDRDTEFAGTLFPAGRTKGTYNFSTYKLTYRYTWRDNGAWRWRVGFTGLIRDANVELRQGDLKDNNDDIGFVPLLHLSGDFAFANRWQMTFDFDGLAGGPGRAFDLAVTLDHELNDRWRIGAGYRMLEGGVDTDSTYNFAWIHYGVISARYRF